MDRVRCIRVHWVSQHWQARQNRDMIPSSPGRRTRGRRIRWFIAILLVALIAIIVAFSLAQIHPVQSYLVAARSLASGTTLASDDVTTRDLDPGSVPPGAILEQDRASALGQQIVIPFAAGDIITAAHLGSTSGRIAGNIPPNMRLFKLITKDVVMPDGLQPGDKIDIILTLHDVSGVSVTEYAIQGLVIQSMAADNSSMTFIVPPAVSELIVHAQLTGQIVILAAPPDETFVVLPPVETDQPCQIFLDSNGNPIAPPTGATPCPLLSPTPQLTPTTTSSP